MNLIESQHRAPAAAMHMMGNLIPDDRVLNALHNSRMVANLSDSEIEALISLITVQYFETKEFIVELDDEPLKSSLMILVEGKIEVSALVDNQPVTLQLETPGDLARIISFVGGNPTSIRARIKIKKDSTVLLLQRSKLETLLHSHPSIVYGVMKNLVRHVHGVARRKNAEMEEMSNYLNRTNGLY